MHARARRRNRQVQSTFNSRSVQRRRFVDGVPMLRFAAFPLLAAPIAAALSVPLAPALAQSSAPLAQVRDHLTSVGTMVADFQQTDRKGQSVSGTLTLKRPGKIRFEYQKGYPVLIVGDGKS